MGAWIEILTGVSINPAMDVAPLVGAWIEIKFLFFPIAALTVAPLVGAWIEIHTHFPFLYVIFSSLPLWERGLKSFK